MNTYEVKFNVCGEPVNIKVKALNSAAALILARREIAMSIKVQGAPELVEGLEKQPVKKEEKKKRGK